MTTEAITTTEAATTTEAVTTTEAITTTPRTTKGASTTQAATTTEAATDDCDALHWSPEMTNQDGFIRTPDYPLRVLTRHTPP